MEKVDIFDELYNKVNVEPATYDEIHGKGLWHQTFMCWLVNKKRNSIIMQQRGPNNRVEPGSLDCSAGGHLDAGEKPEDGFRELEEELGVTIQLDKRHYLGIFRNIYIEDNYINRDFCNVYLAESDFEIKDFKFQDGEVDRVYEVDIDEAIKLFSGKVKKISANIGEGTTFITVEDMCNYRQRTIVDKYYLKVMLAAKGLVEGKDILTI